MPNLRLHGAFTWSPFRFVVIAYIYPLLASFVHEMIKKVYGPEFCVFMAPLRGATYVWLLLAVFTTRIKKKFPVLNIGFNQFCE